MHPLVVRQPTGRVNVSGTPHQPEEHEDEEDGRPETEQQVPPPGGAGIQRLRVDDHLVLLQQAR
jgi:hypothetical protein